MRTCTRNLFAATLTGAMLAPAAVADLPTVLDRIPADALGAVVAPSVDSLDRSAANLFAAVGMPVLTTPSQFLGEAGFREGLDTTRPIALAMIGMPEEGQQEPPAIILAPTTDFEALVGNFDVETIDGLATFEINGAPAFAKPVEGGYALIAPSAQTLLNFDAGGGHMAAHAKMFGTSALRVAEGSDAFAFLNLPAIAPALEEHWETMEKEAVDGMWESIAMGPAGATTSKEDVEAFIGGMVGAVRGAVNDGQYLAIGVEVGALGVGAQMGLDFEAGSETAALFDTPGNAPSMLDRLPDKPFLFASSMDMRSTGAQRSMKFFSEMSTMAGGGEVPSMATMVDETDGNAMVMYPSPAGIMGGLFSNTVYFVRSKNPDAYIKGMNEMLQKAGENLPFTGSVAEQTERIDGVEVRTYSMQVQADPNQPGAMQMAQAMQMLYGGPNISGLIAEREDGLIMTAAPNRDLMTTAIGSYGGEQGLGANVALSQVRDRLPSPAAVEMYVGVRSVWDMLSPFMAMFGMQMNVQIPQDLPPVGMTVATGESGMRAGTFMPAQVIQTGMTVAAELQAMMAGGGQQQWDDGGQEQDGQQDEQEDPPF